MSSDRLQLDDKAAVEEALRPLTHFLAFDKLHTLARKFSETYTYLAQNSQEHFLATAVTSLPTGHETGNFLAIDFGGTYLRVGLVELLGDDAPQTKGSEEVRATSKVVQQLVKAWPIGDHLKNDRAEELFAWIGDCIAEVVRGVVERDDKPFLGDEIPLGVTFSFPVIQESMAEATIMAMGKGFAVTSDLSLGAMVLAGYARHCTSPLSDGINGHAHPLPRIRIAAISNDTVATFFSLVYATETEPASKTAMGLICGTGCNATIPMKLKHLHPSKRASVRLPDGADRDESTVVINTEWTIRGVDVPMKELDIPTKWDAILDAACEAPGFQPFEYMLAGRYFGELVRIAFIDLLRQSLPIDQSLPEALMEKNAISTGFLSQQRVGATDKLPKQLQELFPSTDDNFAWSSEHASLLMQTALAAQQRGSALIAAAIVGLLACAGEVELDEERSEQEEVHPPEQTLVAAYCGAMFSRYPRFLEVAQAFIDQLVRDGSPKNQGIKVSLESAVEGGVIGAAVLAGMAEQMKLP